MTDIVLEPGSAFDDPGLLGDTGTWPIETLDDLVRTYPVPLSESAVSALFDQILAEAEATVAAPELSVMQEAFDAVDDAVNDGIVPPSEVPGFFRWLRLNEGVTALPSTGTYAFVQGYVMQWAQGNGWATLGPNPVPTPVVQQVVQSANASAPETGGTTTTAPAPTAPAPSSAPPLPGAQVPPPTLPAPTVGQTTTVAQSATVTSSTVTGGTDQGTSAPQVSAALAVTAVNVLQVVAKVVDAMLPGMSPGQVPEALSQINRAVDVLETQMAQVRAGTWPRGYSSLLNAVEGIINWLQGLDQSVGTLQSQMAEQANSGLEDSLNTQGLELAALGATVGTVVGTTIPELSGGLQSLTSTVGSLDNTVTNEVEPQLATTTAATEANTEMLSGTDKDCLDALCDAENNVTDPIQEGGATPSLLRNLGSLLGKALELGFIATIVDALLAIADAKVTVDAVVQDTELITNIATSAASVIEADLSWQGAL